MTQTVVTDAAGIPLYVTDDSPATPTAPGARTLSGGTTFLGAITPSGGVASTGRSLYSTTPIGGVAYGSLGNDAVSVSGTIYVAEIFIPRNFTVTGIGVLTGSTTTADKAIVALFASAGGAAVATSDLAGTTLVGTDNFQEIPLTATYAAVGPARFWVAFQLNGTTNKMRRIAVSTYLDSRTKSYTGTFGTITSLTVPTGVVANVGPFAYVY